MENKKRKIKPMEVILYILTAISLVCAVLMLIGAISYIHNYYSSYGMSIASGWKDAVQYILNNSGNWLVFALLFFAAARIVARLDTINPDFGKKQRKAQTQLADETYPQPEAAMAETTENEGNATAPANETDIAEEPVKN